MIFNELHRVGQYLLSMIWLSTLSVISVYGQPPSQAQLSDRWSTQVTTYTALQDTLSIPRLTQDHIQAYSSHKLRLNPYFCRKEQQARTQFQRDQVSQRVRDYHLKTTVLYAKACGVYIHADAQHRLIGFSLNNDSDNPINPQSRTKYDSQRLFVFRFEERVKQNISLKVRDQVGVSGQISLDFMETTMIFIPRRVLPYIRYHCPSCTRRQFAVVLPTTEELIFDAVTHELKGGVLRESPIDTHPNARLRRFARLKYAGQGILIRADRRAGSPERIYPHSYNQYEDIRHAIITYQNQTCRVPKNLIWVNTLSQRATPYFKYATDQEFLAKVIRPYCRWDISLNDLHTNSQSPSKD